jgi:hypothetical protein
VDTIQVRRRPSARSGEQISRPNYEDGVLRRADIASLQVWTQTALRIVSGDRSALGAYQHGSGLVLDGLLWRSSGPRILRSLGSGVVLHGNHHAAIRLNPVQGRALHHRQHVPLPELESITSAGHSPDGSGTMRLGARS